MGAFTLWEHLSEEERKALRSHFMGDNWTPEEQANIEDLEEIIRIMKQPPKRRKAVLTGAKE